MVKVKAGGGQQVETHLRDICHRMGDIWSDAPQWTERIELVWIKA